MDDFGRRVLYVYQATFLLLTNFDIAYSDTATIVIDAPAVFLNAVDTLGIAHIVVDVHHKDRIIGIDVNLVGVVCRTFEPVAVNTIDEALTCGTFLLKVNLTVVLVLRIDNHRIILV